MWWKTTHHPKQVERTIQKVAQQSSPFIAEKTTQPSQINEHPQQTQEIYPADKFKNRYRQTI